MRTIEPSRSNRVPVPGISELAARTDAGLLVVHDAGPQPVESVVLHEPDARQRIPAGAVVLAVGYQADSPQFDRLVAAAAEASAVAVVAKPSSVGRDSLRLLGEQHAISTILAEQSADWLAVASMLRSAAAITSVDAIAGIRVGDLFAFANAIALATGGAAAIVDPAGRLLGFSNLADQPLDDLRRRTTLLMAEQDSPAEDPDYRLLYATTGCIRVPPQGDTFARIAIAVRSDREILGSVWILSPPGHNQDRAEAALDQLVESAAVHLHHARAELDVQRSRHAQLLQSLLRGEEAAVSSAATLGIEEQKWFRLAILVPDSSQATSMSRRQVHSVSNWLNIVHSSALFAEINSLLVVLFSGQHPEEWPPIERSLDTFLRNADALHGAIAVATSLAVTDVQDLSSEFSRLHILARTVARAPTDDGDRSPIYRMENYWARVELTTIADAYATAAARRLARLADIRRYDRDHDSEYWKTLHSFVLCDRNVNEAAAQLNLHPNTVRYRIGQLRTTFHLDLSDPPTFLWIAVQMYHPGIQSEFA